MEPEDRRVGSDFAGYRIEGLIGRGGMGAVYMAEHLRLKRRVALKVLVPELADRDDFRDRFIRESQMAASFEHPNVIPIYDSDEEDGVLYLAMRYIGGSDLRTVLEKEGRLDAERTLSIVAQTASALDTAHAHGLVHRDVKPANVLIADPGHRVYLTDFGIAKQTAATGVTKTGFFVGTLGYAAPEQIEGKPVTPAIDVYALGCVLYECLAGEPPFVRDSDVAMLYAHVLDAPPRLTERRPDLPSALDGVIATAMAKSPGQRYSTCTGLTEALRAAIVQPAPTTLAAPARSTVPPPPAAVANSVPEASVPPPAVPTAAAPTAPAPVTEPAPVTGAARPAGGRPRWALPLLFAVLVLAVGVASLLAVSQLGDGDDSGTGAGDVDRILSPVLQADSALAASLSDLTSRDAAALAAIRSAASDTAEAVTRAQGAAGEVELPGEGAAAEGLLGEALDANLLYARRVATASTDLTPASASAAQTAESNTRQAYTSLAGALPGLKVPPATALSGAGQLVALAAESARPAPPVAAGDANREYVEAIDRLLTNSAKTRKNLGTLINEVSGGSISFADARGRIDAIINQRQSLQNSVAAIRTPAAFRAASGQLNASISAALDDDFAIQAWINARYTGDPGVDARFAEHLDATERASAAKSTFVRTYDRQRRRLLDLGPLEVGASY